LRYYVDVFLEKLRRSSRDAGEKVKEEATSGFIYKG